MADVTVDLSGFDELIKRTEALQHNLPSLNENITDNLALLQLLQSVK